MALPGPSAAGAFGDEVAGRAEPAGLVYPTISDEITAAVAAMAAHVLKHGDSPVRSIRRFRRDVVVMKTPPEGFTSKGRPAGAVITEFSHQSRYRLLHLVKNCDVDFKSMVTATYPKEFTTEGVTVKHHLHCLQMWFRHHFHGCKGVWFLEFQKRGAPHFHILLDVDLESYGPLVKRNRTRSAGSRAYRTCGEMERDLSAAWYRIVDSGDEKHLRAGVCWEAIEHTEGALRYAAKHAAKPHQKRVPEQYQNVGRFWGKLGKIRVEMGEMEQMTTAQLLSEKGPCAISNTGKIKKYIWDKM